ncbi:type II toxin-antitoxin system mRNA interferase toxin, RelE/StbE family [Vibrio sonorensis]|uniref:type II toxin-antitoxin system mRNA interferase toxin, RelE/StbE family n=1 Tax=Vibrio sonorensis TaxID=1004316 RepID=UPI000A02170E|nr:type II toxin-antitoxin system mRNA interferase toxin, RelE/StbE family [Vibrio sonorensis]
MTTRILADVAASITELKANPMKVATSAHGEPVAVLNRNEPAFYCVPAEAYEMMMDRLDFKKSALKEWKKLGSTLQQQFKKKLIERLQNPHVPASKLSGADNMCKIKLRQFGYRLVYKVEDDVIIVTVLAVGKRERNDVYLKAIKRLDD